MEFLPTTHLYFLNACQHAVRHLFRRGPIRRLGANCYEAGDTILLIRRDAEALMDRLQQHPPKRLVYLIDDDIEAAREDLSLPPDYRDRLIRFHDRYHSDFVARAEILVVTSPALLRKFSTHRDARLLHPIWHREPADDSHFDSLDRGGPIHAIHLGTASHSAGLAFLKPVLEALLERHPRFHFTYIRRAPALGLLDAHPRIHRLRPQSWQRYRWSLPQKRFHLGLYPLPDTPFNRARSRNKLLEHGVVGAVGVYPCFWPTAMELDGGAILVGDTSDEWVAALSPYLHEPSRLRPLARTAHSILHEMNDPAAQRKFWGSVLSLPL